MFTFYVFKHFKLHYTVSNKQFCFNVIWSSGKPTDGDLIFYFCILISVFHKTRTALISRFLSMLHVAWCLSQRIIGVGGPNQLYYYICIAAMLCTQCCNKKVLLCERKRHTDRGVSSTSSVIQYGGGR